MEAANASTVGTFNIEGGEKSNVHSRDVVRAAKRRAHDCLKRASDARKKHLIEVAELTIV